MDKQTNFTSTVIITVICIVVGTGGKADTAEYKSLSNDSVLYLLNILPFRDNHSQSGWDEGLELIPAAHLALKQINRKNILGGYKLDVINVNSEACSLTVISEGIKNFVKYTFHSKIAIGVIGLFCSTVTKLLSPVAGHAGIELLQISSSFSPEFALSPDKYPHLYRTTSSTLVWGDAVVGIMKQFKWKKISILREEIAGLFYSSTARAVANRVEAEKGFEIVVNLEINHFYTSQPLAVLQESGGRIIVVSASLETVKKLLCDALYVQPAPIVGPAFVYIILLHSLEDIKTPNNDCDITSVIEGGFLINFQLFRKDSKEIISGQTYAQFNTSYYNELQKFSEQNSNVNQNGSLYAAVMYDQVWIFALALNRSIEMLGNSFSDYYYGNGSAITKVIENELANLSFEGASGLIEFGPTRQTVTDVNVELIMNGITYKTVTYSQLLKSLTSNFSDYANPPDSFEVIHTTISKWLVVASYLLSIACFTLVTVVLLLHVYFRDNKEIKATSLFMCNIIFLGCYFLCFGFAVKTTNEGFVLPVVPFTILCNLEQWFNFLGIDIIFTALFVRLLRIYYIFTRFKKMGRFWDNKTMALIIALVCLGHSVVLVTWAAVDTLQYKENVIFHPQGSLSFYEHIQRCDSQYLLLWWTLLYAYATLLLAFVVFLAIKTRHIRRQEFKDTKKVNVFVFLFFIILVPTLSLNSIFISRESYTIAFICYAICYNSMILLCEFCLFIPKVAPLIIKHFYH